MDLFLQWLGASVILIPVIAAVWGFARMDQSRFTHLPRSDKRTMVFPWAYRAFWGGSAFLMSGLAFALSAVTLLGDGHVVGAGLSALGAAAMGYAFSGTRFRSELTSDSIRYQGLFRSTIVSWDNISSITWSQLFKCFRLRVAGGRYIRISAGLTNLPEFARLILAGVPSARIDGQSRYLLAETAQGNPPSVIDGSV